MEPTVRDVLAFHCVDRAAYERLLSLGAGRQPARDTVALLMWLHHRIGVDALASVRSMVRTPGAAAQLISEARAVLNGATCWPSQGAERPETPLISSMCGGGVGTVDVCRFFELIPDDAPRRGVAEVLVGVGALVFEDRLHALLRRYELEGGGAFQAELAAPYRRGDPPSSVTTEDDGGRSLFITFSKGFPLTREEIDEYFTERWGDCVERVMMERTPLGKPPAYGRVVFRHAAVAAAVLDGQRLVKLVVNGRHLWARKYVRRQLQQHYLDPRII